MIQTLRYSILYIFFVLLIAFAFRSNFPHNHAYGSLAAWMVGFIYAAYFSPNIKNILASLVVYFMILYIDAYFMFGFLSATDLSGSILFPAMGAMMFVSPLVITLLVKLGMVKIKTMRDGRRE